MATIKDVAKMAGVSTTTVSHVINKTRFVAKETEQQVLQAIKNLNYSPSAVARSLKVNTTKSIGMIVTTAKLPILQKLFIPWKSFVIDKVILYFYATRKIIRRKSKTISTCWLKNVLTAYSLCVLNILKTLLISLPHSKICR